MKAVFEALIAVRKVWAILLFRIQRPKCWKCMRRASPRVGPSLLGAELFEMVTFTLGPWMWEMSGCSFGILINLIQFLLWLSDVFFLLCRECASACLVGNYWKWMKKPWWAQPLGWPLNILEYQTHSEAISKSELWTLCRFSTLHCRLQINKFWI